MVNGQTYTATFPTEEEAAEWLAVARGRVVGARAARRLTVEEYTRRWLGEFIDTAADIDRQRCEEWSIYPGHSHFRTV